MVMRGLFGLFRRSKPESQRSKPPASPGPSQASEYSRDSRLSDAPALDEGSVSLVEFTRGKPVGVKGERGRPAPESVMPKPRQLLEPKRMHVKSRALRVSLPEEIVAALEREGVNPRVLLENFAFLLADDNARVGEEGAVITLLKTRLKVYDTLLKSIEQERARIDAERVRVDAEIKRLYAEHDRLVSARAALDELYSRLPRVYAEDEKTVRRLEALVNARNNAVFPREEWEGLVGEVRASAALMRGMRDPYTGATFRRLVRLLNRLVGLELPQGFWRGVFERHGGFDAWVKRAVE